MPTLCYPCGIERVLRGVQVAWVLTIWMIVVLLVLQIPYALLA